MEIIKAFVTREKLVEVFSIIDKELSAEPNTQVYIENNIYYSLRKLGYKHNIYSYNFMKGSHYDKSEDGFGIEEWIGLSDGCYLDKVIAKASFVSNCSEYKQLVQFDSSKVKDYKHFLTGFKKLLLIQFEN